MKNYFEYFLFVAFAKFFQFLGLKKTRKFIRILGIFFFYCIPIRKAIVIKNLKIAFPELNEAKIKRLALESFINAGTVFAEMLVIPKLSEKELLDNVDYTIPEEIRELINKEQGIVFLTAHMGNWEIAAITTTLSTGRHLSVVYKKMRNPYVDKWIEKMRSRFNKAVAVGISIKEIYQELLKKQMVGIVADQRAPKKSPKVKFFGQEITAFAGPAMLSLKLNVPVLLTLVNREKNGKYKCTMELLKVDENIETVEDKILNLTQKYFNKLEEKIRQYPEQWFWMHNRWKH